MVTLAAKQDFQWIMTLILVLSKLSYIAWDDLKYSIAYGHGLDEMFIDDCLLMLMIIYCILWKRAV